MHHLNREMTNKAVPTAQSYFFSEVIEGLNSSSMNQGENVFVFKMLSCSVLFTSSIYPGQFGTRYYVLVFIFSKIALKVMYIHYFTWLWNSLSYMGIIASVPVYAPVAAQFNFLISITMKCIERWIGDSYHFFF